MVTPGAQRRTKKLVGVMQKVEPSGFWKLSIWVLVAGFLIPGFLVVLQIGSNGYLHSSPVSQNPGYNGSPEAHAAALRMATFVAKSCLLECDLYAQLVAWFD